jgi:hypothetical protein
MLLLHGCSVLESLKIRILFRKYYHYNWWTFDMLVFSDSVRVLYRLAISNLNGRVPIASEYSQKQSVNSLRELRKRGPKMPFPAGTVAL